MELRQLRYFVAIAEEGNFSRAARRLHVSQPPLSTQIKSLEDELGMRLLERSNRGVSLTAAGSVFYEETRAVLARLEHARGKALRADRGDIGMLAVGFVSIADYGVLPPALKHFRASFPLVDVHREIPPRAQSLLELCEETIPAICFLLCLVLPPDSCRHSNRLFPSAVVHERQL